MEKKRAVLCVLPGQPGLCLILRPCLLPGRGLGCLRREERVAAKKQDKNEENGDVGRFRPDVRLWLGTNARIGGERTASDSITNNRILELQGVQLFLAQGWTPERSARSRTGGRRHKATPGDGKSGELRNRQDVFLVARRRTGEMSWLMR